MAKKLKFKCGTKSRRCAHSNLNINLNPHPNPKGNSRNRKSISIHKILKKCTKSHRKWGKQELIDKQNAVRRFECSQCNFFCFRRLDWNRHGLYHFYQQRARLPCPHCSHTFGQEDILKLHLKTHGILLSPVMPVLSPEEELLSQNGEVEQDLDDSKDKERIITKESPNKNDNNISTLNSQKIPSSVHSKNEETEKLPQESSRKREEMVFVETELKKTKEIPEISKNVKSPPEQEIKSKVSPKSIQISVLRKMTKELEPESKSKAIEKLKERAKENSVEVITLDDSSNDEDVTLPNPNDNLKNSTNTVSVLRPWEEKSMVEFVPEKFQKTSSPIMLNNISIQVSPKTPPKAQAQNQIRIQIQEELRSPPVLCIVEHCDENNVEKISPSKVKVSNSNSNPNLVQSRGNLVIVPQPKPTTQQTLNEQSSKLLRRKSSEFHFVAPQKIVHSKLQRRSSCESEKLVPLLFPKVQKLHSPPQKNLSQVESPKRQAKVKQNQLPYLIPYQNVKMSLLNHLLNRKQSPKEGPFFPNIFNGNGNDHRENSNGSISTLSSESSKLKSNPHVFSSLQIPISCIDESFLLYQHKLQKSSSQSNGSPRKSLETNFPSPSHPGSEPGKILNLASKSSSKSPPSIQSESKSTTPEMHTVFIKFHPPPKSMLDGANTTTVPLQLLNPLIMENKESANPPRVQLPSTTNTNTNTNRTTTTTTNSSSGTLKSKVTSKNGTGAGRGQSQSTTFKSTPVQMITQNAQHPAFASIPPPLRMSNSGGIVIERSPRKKSRRIEDFHLLDKEMDLISAPWVACPFCAYRTSISGQLTAHMLVHTGQYDVPYACGSCEFFCVEREVLKKHRLLNHSAQSQTQTQASAQVQIQVQVNGQGQSNRHEYEELIRIPTSSNGANEEENGSPIKCGHLGCPYSAKHKSLLKSHVISHLRQKPFVCPMCSRGFGRKSHVTRHMRIHEKKKTVAAAEALTMLANSSGLPRFHHTFNNSSPDPNNFNSNSNSNADSNSRSPTAFTEVSWPISEPSQMISANNQNGGSSSSSLNNHHHLNGSYETFNENENDNDNEPVDYSMK